MRIDDASQTQLTEPPQTPLHDPTPVVPLDYSPREQRMTPSKVITFLRRLSISAGIAFMVGAIGVVMFPYRDEEVAFFCFGLGLVLLAIPLPKLPGW